MEGDVMPIAEENSGLCDWIQMIGVKGANCWWDPV
jgi:hypothetical protein